MSGIPQGWKLVPIEPTEEMVMHGFESPPHPIFQPEHWDDYEEMSGCQQAALRAKLWWAAMLAAAPAQPETREAIPSSPRVTGEMLHQAFPEISGEPWQLAGIRKQCGTGLQSR